MDKNQAEKEMEKTLNMFQQLKDIEVSPQFMQKLERRIMNSRAQDPPVTLYKLSFAAALLVIMVFLNITSFFSVLKPETDPASQRRTCMVALAREYSVSETIPGLTFEE